MRDFLPYIHNLRGLAILFVIGVHASGLNNGWKSHPVVDNILENIFDPTEGNGTVLFLFIGGFLFQYLTHKYFDYKKYLEQKFKVIVMPYLLISIPLILIRIVTGFDSLALPSDFHERSVFRQIIFYLFTGTHMPPFWFITTIILIYFTAPLFRWIDNEKFYRYVFPFIPLIYFFTFRPSHNANPIFAYLHFVPVYITGMWVSHYRNRILSSRFLLYIVISGFTIISIFNFAGWTSEARNLTFEKMIAEQIIFFNIYSLKAFLLCFLLLMILYRMRERPMPVLYLLGDYSFGIFFVHYLFISITRKILEMLDIVIPFSVPAYLIFFIVLLGASTLTVFIVKKITGRYSRYLIGS